MKRKSLNNLVFGILKILKIVVLLLPFIFGLENTNVTYKNQ